MLEPATRRRGAATHAAAADDAARPRARARDRDARGRQGRRRRRASPAARRRVRHRAAARSRDSGDELATFQRDGRRPSTICCRRSTSSREAARQDRRVAQERADAHPPLEQVTTSSLEALRSTRRARAQQRRGELRQERQVARGGGGARHDLRQGLSQASGSGTRNLNYPREKFGLGVCAGLPLPRPTDRERTSPLQPQLYFGGPLRDRGREVAAFDDYMARYPDDNTAPNNSGLRFMTRRQFARAESSVSSEHRDRLERRRAVRQLAASPGFRRGSCDEADKISADMHRRFPQ